MKRNGLFDETDLKFAVDLAGEPAHDDVRVGETGKYVESCSDGTGGASGGGRRHSLVSTGSQPSRFWLSPDCVCSIRPLPGQLAKVADLAKQVPQVAECHRITGEDCFILKIYLTDVSSLDRILDRFLAHGQTTTSIVQSSPVPPRSLPLPKKPI